MEREEREAKSRQCDSSFLCFSFYKLETENRTDETGNRKEVPRHFLSCSYP